MEHIQDSIFVPSILRSAYLAQGRSAEDNSNLADLAVQQGIMAGEDSSLAELAVDQDRSAEQGRNLAQLAIPGSELEIV